MSFIQDYRRDLDDQRRIAGADNEGAVSQVFASLLKASGAEYKLIFSQQYSFKSKDGHSTLRADGVVVDRIRLVHGWWEAKDSKDDLDKEIEAKIAKGYPIDNIIFEDTITAVLYQHEIEVLRIPLSDDGELQKLLDLFFSYVSREVENFREAKTKFLLELPGVAAALTAMVADAYQNNIEFHAKAKSFLELCQRAIGPKVTEKHVDEMLIQHVLTEQTFQAVFPASMFHRANHLACAITELELIFLRGEKRVSLLSRLEPYFAAIRRAAANAVTSEDKQSFLKEVYEDFYTAYNPKDADKLGMVYTPNEVVRFIIEGCDWLTTEHFKRRLADPGVDILDPCTGTGTFVVDLIDYMRGDRQALIRKFDSEIHANEISILPYYIACLNIEQTLYDATGTWKDFKGACFVNTLDNWGFEQRHQGAQYDLLGGMTDENHERIMAQNARKIPVVIGNPPYNANQQNENDNNKNDAAIVADKRIKETYIAASTAQKTKMYDPYIRFFRWASDRIGDEGVIGFITNRSYLDARQADGFRKVVEKEFQEIWVVDLMGNARQTDGIKGEQGGNIFGIMTGVAIVFLVRNPKKTGCDIRYIAAPPYPLGKEKLRWLTSTNLRQLSRAGDFARIIPNERGDWINQPEHDWSEWLPVASKDTKAGKNDEAIFNIYSLGAVTNRDEWVYGYSKNEVSRKVRHFIAGYEKTRLKFKQALASNPKTKTTDVIDRSIKWTSELERATAKNIEFTYVPDKIIESMYRPFVVKNLYWDKYLTHRRYTQPKIFGENGQEDNFAIYFTDRADRSSFAIMVTTMVGNLNLCSSLDAFQSLSLWTYSADGTRHDNITDWSLKQFRSHYTDETIEKRDIFDYVYAVLHNPAYREKYARNLKAEFPRIPFYSDFRQWAAWGKRLIDLHTGYARLKGHPLQRVDDDPNGRKPNQRDITGIDTSGKQEGFGLAEQVSKSILKADKSAGIIKVDAITRIEGIPPEAWLYRLGNRSALEWVMAEYSDFTPKDPTIREKFNVYRFADHKEDVIALLGKVCRVSVETVAITEDMMKSGEC